MWPISSLFSMIFTPLLIIDAKQTEASMLSAILHRNECNHNHLLTCPFIARRNIDYSLSDTDSEGIDKPLLARNCLRQLFG